ncbi:MAG TPA: trehalose-6-phosphate synthase, partial [Vicinamibacterales bacterium]|nr:trehalose-6-phosphate synthase [Vicinamibacterales bacterium]
WPLCHDVHVRPRFRQYDFQAYRDVNRRFAAAVCDEVGAESTAMLFVHDYHFALAPRMLRTQLPLATVVAFWHIPWPGPATFRVCPWGRELIEGLLGAHILGFQTPQDCANFLACAESLLPCNVDRGRSAITYRGRSTLVHAYPVGVAWEDCAATAPPIDVCRTAVRRDLGLAAGALLGIGIDRLDYTKGIDEKFRAVERLLEIRSDLAGRFTFVQVAEPSRDCLPAYQAARTQLSTTCDRVNTRFASGSYRPIVLLERHHEPADVERLYRAADVCYVGSLRDGMNLVAKEFVRARDDERGVLVLSRFAGASRQLAAALRIDPYDTDDGAHTLGRALAMSGAEQAKRMRHLRRVVRRFDARWWGAEILRDATLLNAQVAVRSASAGWRPCSSPP